MDGPAERDQMTKNLAVLCVLTVVAVAGAGCGNRAATPEAGPGEATSSAGKLTIGVMPKLIGIDYFNATRQGAEEAARELGVELVYDGPVTNDTTAQSQMIDTWIAKK